MTRIRNETCLFSAELKMRLETLLQKLQMRLVWQSYLVAIFKLKAFKKIMPVILIYSELAKKMP